MQITNLGFRK